MRAMKDGLVTQVLVCLSLITVIMGRRADHDQGPSSPLTDATGILVKPAFWLLAMKRRMSVNIGAGGGSRVRYKDVLL